MELREAFFIAIVEHLQKGRDEELEFGIFGELVDADGHEIPNPFAGRVAAVIAGDHRQILVGPQSHFHLSLQGQSDTVHVVIGVGKMGHFHLPAVFPHQGPLLREAFEDLFRKLLLLGKHRESHKVGGKHRIEGTGGTQGMEQLEEVGPGNMIQDVIAKMGQHFVGELVDELEPFLVKADPVTIPIPILHHLHELRIVPDEF